MKTRIITAIAALLLPAAMPAQTNLNKAIDNFLANENIVDGMSIDKQVSTSTDDSGKQSSFYFYEFSMPKNKSKEFTPLKLAFNRDAGNAYRVYTSTADNPAGKTITLAYGDNLSQKIEFGTQSKRNYLVMLVRDNEDKQRRYAYGLVWYEDKKKDRFCGSITKIYSLDPDVVKSRKIMSSNNRKSTTSVIVDGKRIGLDDKGINIDGKYLSYKVLSAAASMPVSSSNGLSVSTSSNNGRTSLTVNGVRIYLRSNGIDVNGRFVPYSSFNEGQTSAITSIDTENTVINTSMDFLQRFGNLRASYRKSVKNHDDLELQTAFVNRIVALCNSHRNLLSNGERDIVANELKDMKSLSTDKYLATLLGNAANTVKKK